MDRLIALAKTAIARIREIGIDNAAKILIQWIMAAIAIKEGAYLIIHYANWSIERRRELRKERLPRAPMWKVRVYRGGRYRKTHFTRARDANGAISIVLAYNRRYLKGEFSLEALPRWKMAKREAFGVDLEKKRENNSRRNQKSP